MKHSLNIVKKSVYVLTISFVLISSVYAYASNYTGTGWLKNEIKSVNKVVNDHVTAYITKSGSYSTQITNISNVENINSGGGDAANGIRVYTTIYTKKTSGLFASWKKRDNEGYNTVYPSSSQTNVIEWFNSGELHTRIEWQNRTGNTQFYGQFNAS